MPMTVGKDKNNPNKFSYEIYHNFNLIEFGNNYPTKHEAETAANIGFRLLHTNNFNHTDTPFQNDYMTLDEILNQINL